MRKRFNIILLMLLCLFCIMPDAMADTNYTANTTINIRAKADKNGKVLGKVQAGDTITVSSIEGDWAAIDFKGKTAYVSKEYITEVVEENHPKEKKKDTSTEDNIFLIVIFALIVGIVYGFYKLVRKLLSSAAAGAKKISEIVEKQIDNSRQQTALQQETNELRKKLEDVKRNAQEEQAKKDADLEDVRKKAQEEQAREKTRAVLTKRLEEAEEQRAYAAKFEAVDLGLSVKWANMNIGAEEPSQSGGFFAWGEIEPKEDYYWETYRHGDGSTASGITKYSSKIDGKNYLDKEDDVANMKMSGKWRMPSKEEFEELKTKCQWQWLNSTGRTGYIVKGPNGNSIFLPAAGYRFGTSFNNEGECGRYWSSSLYAGLYAFLPDSAWYLDFSSSRVNVELSNRFFGHCVRPVCE